MALSGTFYKNVGSYWRLQLEWSASQNISNNTSTITTKLYWMGLNGNGTTYSSATKDGAVTIDGSTYTFSGSGLGKLYGGQKKLIDTSTKTVSHDSDGSKSLSFSAYFDVELTLSGTYYGRVSVSGSATLNTIPRSSSLSSSASWTAGSNRSISISRASSSFTHTAKIYVDGSLIKTITGIRSSTTASFSTSENTAIFNKLNGGSSKSTEIQLLTYSGSSHVGTKTYTGTVTAPSSSTTSFGGSFNIGDTMSGTISQKNSAFTHTIQLLFGSSTFTLHSKTAASSWSYNTSNIAASLYNLTPNSNTLSGEIRIYTYYNGVQVRSYHKSNLNAYVKNSNPTFSSSQVTYKDTRPDTLAITGNNQILIQGLSTLDVTIGSAATAKNSASISRYEVTVNGQTERRSSPGTLSFQTVDASSNITMKTKVVDSRGNSTEVSKTINMIPYKPPTLTPGAERTDGFGSETTIDAHGSYSPLMVNDVPKNEILEVTYRFKPAKGTTDIDYGPWIQLSPTGMGLVNKYSTYSSIQQFDNTLAFDVQFRVRDNFSSTGASKRVSVGRPIFFIDDKLSSISFNDFPRDANEFRINGQIVFGANLWASGATEGITGGINMNNSDIVNVNGIFFNDLSNNSGEGLLFLKSGSPEGSYSSGDYDNFYIRDRQFYLNNSAFMEFLPKDSLGDGVRIGAGGITIVGAGESSLYMRDHETNWGWEHLYLTSDTDIHMMSGMQGGVSGSWDWVFDRDGFFKAPDADGVDFDKFGNVKARSSSTSGSWNVLDANGKVQLGVATGKNNSRIVEIGQFKFHSGLDSGGGEGVSAIVFREYASDNKEFIIVDEGSNGYYFNADQGLPSAGGTGTANGNLYAAKFNVVSDIELKEDVAEFSNRAIDKIRKTKTHTYKHKRSKQRQEKMKEKGVPEETSLGLIAQQAPQEIKVNGKESIDLYGMSTFLWKGLQDNADDLDELKAEVKKLKKEKAQDKKTMKAMQKEIDELKSMRTELDEMKELIAAMPKPRKKKANATKDA